MSYVTGLVEKVRDRIRLCDQSLVPGEARNNLTSKKASKRNSQTVTVIRIHKL